MSTEKTKAGKAIQNVLSILRGGAKIAFPPAVPFIEIAQNLSNKPKNGQIKVEPVKQPHSWYSIAAQISVVALVVIDIFGNHGQNLKAILDFVGVLGLVK